MYNICTQVTCHAIQDTDNDMDTDNTELSIFEGYRSAPAYCTNEVEVFELYGKVLIYM